MSQKAAILSLPPEILDMIWAQLSKLELKTTRLSCKFLHKLGTPMLFAVFNLYPHIRSFERLVSISKSENIRQHIRILSYFADFSGILPRFVKQIESVCSSQVSAAEKDRILAHARLLKSQALRIDVPMDGLLQFKYLVRIFPHLRGLEAIKLFELSAQESISLDDDELPHFYEQMKQETCGQYPHMRLPKGVMSKNDPTTGTCAQLLLMASDELQNPLQDLELDGISWISFLQGGDFARDSLLYHKHFTNLKCLCLRGGHYNLFPLPGLLMRNLQNLLKMATNLERLELCLDNNADDNVPPPHDKILRHIKRVSMFDSSWGIQDSVNPSRLTWTNDLQQLALRGLRCTAGEFKNVLRPCVATLEVLQLEDIELLPNDHQPGTPKACWVRVMKWMQRHLVRLKSIELGGQLTNGGMQTWFINSMIRFEDLLLERTCQFFLKGGTCPLELFAIKPGAYDFTKETSGDETPDYIFEDDRYEGDQSWRMEYDGLYDDDDEDDMMSPTDDGFDPVGFITDEELDEDEDPWPYENEL